MRAILTYHSIDASGSPISIDESSFRAHVRWLSSGRVKVVPLLDLVSNTMAEREDDDRVAITFDDGYESVGRVAAPLLREHGLPATIFVVTDFVGRTNAWDDARVLDVPSLPLLDWDALHRLAADNVEIAAHTRRHKRLTELDPGEREHEIVGSAHEIERVTGRRPTSFAYPYGAVDAACAELVRGHFTAGCGTALGVLTPESDAARLPRLDMYYFREPGRLEEWGSPAFRRRLWVRAQARRVRQLVVSGRVDS